MNATLLFSSFALVFGGLLLTIHVLVGRREPLAPRLARAEGALVANRRPSGGLVLPDWLLQVRTLYERELRRAGGAKTFGRLVLHKALLAFAAPFVVLIPYAAATGIPPSLALVLVLAVASSFVPDLLLRQEVRRRRDAIFLDLPEAISVLALALGAGQSLRQALALAGRDCGGAKTNTYTYDLAGNLATFADAGGDVTP